MLRPLTSRDAMLERLQQRVSCRAAVWLASVMIVLPAPGSPCRCAEQPGTTCCCSARTLAGPANGRNCCNRRSDLAPAGRPCCCRKRAPREDAAGTKRLLQQTGSRSSHHASPTRQRGTGQIPSLARRASITSPTPHDGAEESFGASGRRTEAGRATCCLAKAKSVSTSAQTCGGAERCTCCDHESAPPPAIPTGFQPSPAKQLALGALTPLFLDACETCVSSWAHGPGAVPSVPSCGLSVQLCHLTI
jgi:hypothetical protein